MDEPETQDAAQAVNGFRQDAMSSLKRHFSPAERWMPSRDFLTR